MDDKIMKSHDRPVPRLLSEKEHWLYIMVVAFSLILSVSIQQPHELYMWHYPHKGKIIAGFGLIYIVVTCVFYKLLPILFKKTFSPDRWMIRREITALLIQFFSTGVVNWFYALWLISYYQPGIRSFFDMQWHTLEYGIFPIVVLLLYKDVRNLYRNWMLAEKTIEVLVCQQVEVQHHQPVELNKTVYDADKIYLFKTDGNYLYFWVEKNGNSIKRCYQGTMKKLEDQLNGYPQFMRCHNSFMVNTDKLENAWGNSNGMHLKLKNFDTVIPVSSSHTKEFMEICIEKQCLAPTRLMKSKNSFRKFRK